MVILHIKLKGRVHRKPDTKHSDTRIYKWYSEACVCIEANEGAKCDYEF